MPRSRPLRNQASVSVAKCFITLMIACCATSLDAQDKTASEAPSFSEEHLEFFEKQVRPLLSKHCYSCHSQKAKEIKGGLRVDSRIAMLRGGDTGPAILPGDVKDSLLIDAVRYGDVYQMPPKYRLPKSEIAILEKWVSLGSPWPEETDDGADHADEFNLADRQASHWAWRPIAKTDPPAVNNTKWAQDPLDQYVLAKLEEQKLHPADDAEPSQLLRRMSFDIIGLPPSPAEVDSFLQQLKSEGIDAAMASTATRLLDSPQFGERWGRHWLDLMRYAESRGHEFDYEAANAWQFRDYVIRAFNANVPYDQFLKEHLAGDLLKQPRRHPELGFNESVLGTGFWYLGEWVHSPVDIRKDEMDRMDNALDVFSKTFLGMTVACARCHDHKFDAISQKDYYALLGFMQSSAYRQVRFETLEHNRSVAAELEAWERAAFPKMLDAARHWTQTSAPSAQVLQAAVAAVRAGAKFADSQGPQDVVFADFETGQYDSPGFGKWQSEGAAFGDRPVTLKDIADYQGKINVNGRYFVNSHNVRLDSADRGDAAQGTLTSPKFKITHDAIEFLVGGGSHADGTQLQLLVDGKVVRTATGKNNNQMHQHRWDVRDLRGADATIQAIDRRQGGWGNIGFDHVVFTCAADAAQVGLPSDSDRALVKKASATYGVDASAAEIWAAEILRARSRPDHPLHSLALLAGASSSDKAYAEARQWLDGRKSLSLPETVSVVADFADPANLWMDGAAYHSLSAGALRFSANGEPSVVEIGHAALRPAFARLRLKQGAAREPGALGRWDRAGKTLRTPSFELTSGRIHYLVQGNCQVQAVVDSHRTIQGPLHGALVQSYVAQDPTQWRWVTHNLDAYRGHRLHVEISPKDDQPIAVAKVVMSDSVPELPSVGFSLAEALSDSRDEASLIAKTARLLQQPPSNAWLLPALAQPKLRQESAHQLAERAALEGKLQLESLVAPGMWDGSAEDEVLLVRGNVKSPAEIVPRRSLTALGGTPIVHQGSGRLELANELLSPENPLVARVFVNRVWHHLTGKGIVPTVDNFGVLGEAPRNVELLDHLATRFRENGWNIKRLIREIVLSRTYRMSSSPVKESLDADPTNRWSHHMPLRRLQGEAIRDTMLALSGRLDKQRFGPSVPVYLTPFMQGRGRPGQGPLDGNGRRSIYISVRRNFLSPMMLAFDTPQPTTAIGRRTVSNVPAQALILLNDPFVIEQAKGWAKRLSMIDDLEARMERMYFEAFARAPSDPERSAATQFLKRQAEALGKPDDLLQLEPWNDLCHAIFNLKEFIYLP